MEEAGPSQVTTSEDPADRISTAVDELCHQANVREELLDNMAAMVNFPDRTKLADTIRTALGNPAQVSVLESEVKVLQLER